jgi:hypothetical protein
MLAEAVRKPDITPEDREKAKLPLFEFASDKLPTGRRAEVVAYSGDAEDAFSTKIRSKNELIQAEAFDEIIFRCVKSLDGKKPTEADVRNLHDADRRAILLRGRWRTYPDQTRIEFKWRCAPPFMPDGAGCGAEDNHNIFDLETINCEPVILPTPTTLSISKKVLAFDPPTGNTGIYYLKLRKKGIAERTAMMLSRGCQLDGERATEAQLRALIGGDRSAIARALAKNGGPNTRVEVPCSGANCNRLWKTLAEGLPGFFFPGETGE